VEAWCQREAIKGKLQRGRREKGWSKKAKFYFQIGEIALFWS